MSYRLVIAEKPSVAQAYAKVLGATNRNDGYLEGNGYLVSWCVGHLVELVPPNIYDEKFVKWSMKQFHQSGHDCYLVMQLHQDADPVLRFAAMRYLNKQNIAPSIENYEILYRGNLPEGKRSVPQAELLEQLYQKFNFARPTDYHGHSLSVSDVIQDGKISAHYVDSIGFKELPGFLDKKPERTSVLQTLKEKCDAPECNPTVCRKVRDAHEL